MLVVVDEYTRECLAIDVARTLKSDDVLERIAWLMVTRGLGFRPPAPETIAAGPPSAPLRAAQHLRAKVETLK